MMNTFGAQHFSDRDPNNNMIQLNALYMSLLSQGATADREDFALKNYFGDLYLKARFSIENTFDKFLSAAPIELVPSQKFERYLLSMPYTDSMTLRAEIPEGLNVTYLEYLDALMPAQARANEVLENVIKPFELFVGKMISDEVFRNQMGHQVKEFKNLESGYNKVVASMGKCFAKNSYKASADFSQVVKRTGDWKTVFAKTKELKDMYQAFPQQEITKRLNSLYEQLDALVEQVRNDKFERVEKETTRVLSEGMYHVAKEIELAALTTYRSKTFITVLNETTKNVEEMMDR